MQRNDSIDCVVGTGEQPCGTSPTRRDCSTPNNCFKGKRVLPGVFNAAGLMVPEPSIMPPPMPLFIDVDTGCVAEYMTTNGLGLGPSPKSSHRPCWCAKAPVAGYAAGDCDEAAQWWARGLRATARRLSHARTGAN